MIRNPIRRRSAKGIERDKAKTKVYIEVRSRDKFKCRAKLPGCTRDYEHIHHLLPRSGGGGETLENLICICGACHDTIHRNPDMAYERGLLTSRYEGNDNGQ